MSPTQRTRRERLDHARECLRRQPQGRDAWFWQIKVKVLDYFVAVYGDDGRLADDSATLPSSRLAPTRACDSGRRASIRAVLERIAEANDARRP